HPIARHIGFYLGAILAGCTGRLNRRAIVHHHAGHVHVEVEFYSAYMSQFSARGITKLDKNFVHRIFQMALRVNEIHGEVFYFLSRERLARCCGTRSNSVTELLPCKKTSDRHRENEQCDDDKSRTRAWRTHLFLCGSNALSGKIRTGDNEGWRAANCARNH